MLSWFRKHIERHDKAPKRRPDASAVFVRCDDRAISVQRPNAAEEKICWSDLASVTIVTTDAGPLGTDLFWVLADRVGRRGLTVPIDAAGEHDLLKAMQSRLHGFDNMAVIEAMSSTGKASFVVWEYGKREPSTVLS